MRSLGVTALLLAACGPPGHGLTGLSGGPGSTSTSTTDLSTTGSSTEPPTPTSSSDTAPTSDSTTTTTTTGALPVIDLGTPDLGNSGPPVGCQGKIDFLFVIGSYSTMESKQEALIASFPGFVATIEEAFVDFDYHVLIANPIDLWGSQYCPGIKSKCPSDGGCDAIDEPDYPCWANYQLGALTKCDRMQGAGVTFPAGKGATNTPCKYAGGRRYMQKGEPNLAGTFECAARLGYSGGGHSHAWATVQALSEELNGPGGCNEGFLRDDALLVIVWITDSGDLFSPYGPLGWSQLIQAAKGGDQDGIVILGLLDDGNQPEPQYCKTDEGGVDRLGLLMDYFDHTMRASVCLPDYTEFFAEGAELVLDICDVYVPQ